MFWKFGFQNASSIDALLDKDDVSLESILDEDDILQECKGQNTRLIDFFQRVDVLQKLLGYVSGDAHADEPNSLKFPSVATEVLCSEIWSIVETCLNNVDKLLTPFWDSVLDTSPDDMRLRIVMASQFAKVNATFLMKKPNEMLAFIRAQPSIVERMLRHIESPPFVDLLVRIIQLDEYTSDAGVLDWLSTERLIPRLVNLLSPSHSTSTHTVVSDLVKSIISMSAPSPGAGVSDGLSNAPASNLFARQLARQENIEKLVAFVLDDFSFELELLEASKRSDTNSTNGPSSQSVPRPSTPQSPPVPNFETATSSATHSISVIIELIRKNNSDYFEPYLFHTLRTRLIQVQQQMHMESQEGRDALEQAFTELVDRMGVVNLGPLLDVMCDRLERFQQLLHKPRSSSEQFQTTLGPVTPFTFERYRICELYAELLHCSNMSLLNRSPEYDRLYDADGRLQGGLSALEDLANVISSGTGEGQNNGEGDGDEMEPAQEFPVSIGSADLSALEYSDDDEDMTDAHGSSDDGMDEVDINDPPSSVSPPVSPFLENPAERLSVQVPSSPNAVLPIPSPSDRASPTVILSRSSSSLSSLGQRGAMQASFMRSSAKFYSKQIPIGDKLKQRFMETRVLTTLLDLFFAFPWNNFLHSVVYDVLHQILTSRVDKGFNRELAVNLFRDAHLMNRIIEAQRANDVESSKPHQKARLGYMGHLTLISEDVIGALAHFPPDVKSLLAQYVPQPEWDEYVAGRYAETKNKDERLLGGGKPVIAPGAVRGGSKWAVDEADSVSTSASSTSEAGPSDLRGEFRRTSRLVREGSADFGIATVPQDEVEDVDLNPRSPQFATYHVNPTSVASGSSRFDEGSDEDDDDDGGWLSNKFELQPPPVSARSPGAGRRPLSPKEFVGSFESNGNVDNIFDDSFGFDDDNFGPFSDANAAVSSDGEPPLSFTSVGVNDDSAFEGFGDFGDFQSGDGQDTPAGGSWLLASDASLRSGSPIDDVEVFDVETARHEGSSDDTRTQNCSL